MLSRSSKGAYVYPGSAGVRPHAPLSIAGAAISYDANGNMTSDGVRVLAWDEANRLMEVQPTAGAVPVVFKYGPDGGRAKKTSQFSSTIYPSADACRAQLDSIER